MKTRTLIKRIILWLLMGLFCLFPTGCSLNGNPKQTVKKVPRYDWPNFRGDNQLTGVAPGKLPDDPQLLWTFKTGGAVGSSPIIVEGRVYVGSAVGKVVALNLKDGSELWEFKAQAGVEAAPFYFDHKILVGDLKGVFYALDAQNGRLIWKVQTGDRIYGSANLVKVGLLKTPVIVFGSYDNRMYGLEPQTGKVVWTYATNNYINGAPAVLGERVIFGGCDAKAHVISAPTGKRIFMIDAASYLAGSVALADHCAYLGNYEGQVLSFDLNARKILWRYGPKDGGPFFSSPAVGKDRVVIGSRDQYLYCISRRDGKLLWRFRTHGSVDSSPVICGSTVAVGGMDGRVYLLNLANGQKIWSYETGAPIKGSPGVSSSKIVIGAADGRVYAFGEKGS